MSLKFSEVVFGLQMLHSELWFYARSGGDELTHCDKWKGGEICSTGGTLLAMQIGHPDQWEYTSFYDKPDKGLIFDEPDDNSAITPAFLNDVRFWMVMLVTPYIDENGLFVPDEDTRSNCYSG